MPKKNLTCQIKYWRLHFKAFPARIYFNQKRLLLLTSVVILNYPEYLIGPYLITILPSFSCTKFLRNAVSIPFFMASSTCAPARAKPNNFDASRIRSSFGKLIWLFKISFTPLAISSEGMSSAFRFCPSMVATLYPS